jgi:hypothetical protein
VSRDPGRRQALGDDVEAGRRRALREIRHLQLAEVLADFSPVVVSTLLCGLHGPGSDLDVACRVADPDAFEAVVRGAYGRRSGYSVRAGRGDGPDIVVSFLGPSLPVEVFGEDRPVEEQQAVRHFLVWSRLAELGGPDFRRRVRDLRAQGVKTEPAIARVLALPGDPFTAVDRLRDAPNARLRQLLMERP